MYSLSGCCQLLSARTTLRIYRVNRCKDSIILELKYGIHGRDHSSASATGIVYMTYVPDDIWVAPVVARAREVLIETPLDRFMSSVECRGPVFEQR